MVKKYLFSHREAPSFEVNAEGKSNTIATAESELTSSDNQVYSYDEIKKVLNTMDPAGEDESGGGMSHMSTSGNNIVLILVVCLILLGIIVSLILKGKVEKS